MMLQLLFRNSQALKKKSIGWDTKKQTSDIVSVSGVYKNKPICIQFAFVEEDANNDHILLKFNLNSNQSKDGLSFTEIASIVHDLRTPLNGTISLLEHAIKDNGVTSNVKRDLLEPSIESTKRLNFLINDLLDFAQILEGKLRLSFELFDLKKALSQPIQVIKALAREKVLDIELKMDENIPIRITSDQNRLLQIVYNLLGNAIKFTKTGGITLEVTRSLLDSRYIRFAVKDTGYGIKKEDISKLFKNFEKLDNWHDNKVGSGLGLCISNALVKNLGGKSLAVESEEKKGSTFSFVIEDKTQRINIGVEPLARKASASSPHDLGEAKHRV